MFSAGTWRLSLRHLAHHRWRSVVLVLCVAMVVFLPVTAQLLVERHRAELADRAEATPLVAGARGNRFGLTLAALYFRAERVQPIPYGQVEELTRDGKATALPLNVRFTARKRPIVATVPEYFELRGLTAAQGTLPLRIGDVVLGAAAASDLGLRAGDALFSDATTLHDLARPTALKMRVTGVLAGTGTPDDAVVFTDLKTAWILEGRAHGHEDVRSMDEGDIQAKTESVVAVSPKAFEFYEVTDDNAHTFHHHGDDAQFPLTAIVLLPDSERSRTILKTRINRSDSLWQIVVPTTVVAALMDEVLRIKRLFDGVALVLLVVTVLMLALQIVLSAQLRAPEMTTLQRIGCAPRTVWALHAAEIVTVLAVAFAVAGLGVWCALAAVPDLVQSW